MPPKQQGQTVTVAFKKQPALGTPATGAGGTGLEVRASAGLALAVATIESAMFRRNKTKLRPRHGMKTVTTAYETELQVGNCDGIFAGVLGTTAAASFTVTEIDVTSMTITGTGTVLTGASGSFITKGVRAGMMGKFTNMSVSANNGVWFPILSVTASVLTVPTGPLVDNAADIAFTLTIAKSFSTPTPYVEGYYTWEERLGEITTPISKLGVDMKFHSLNITANPTGPVTVGFSLTGTDMTAPSGAASLTSPVYNAQTNPTSLVCLDGAIYRNGIAIVDLTGFTFGLAAPVSLVPVLGSRLSPDVFLGNWVLTGNFTQLIGDGLAIANFLAEDVISVFLHCAEREINAAGPDFVSFYLGNCSFGGWTAPISEGAMTQTMTLLGGSDSRGTGYADSAMLISTSAA